MIGSQIFNKIIIDGQEQNISEIDSNHGKIQLEPGKHNIQYVFKNDITEIPTELFQNCKSLTHLEIPKHFTVANYALDGTMLDNINDYILNFPASYYQDKYYIYFGPIKPTESNISELLKNEQYTKIIPLSSLDDDKMLPKNDNSYEYGANTIIFDIDKTDNGKLYLLIWEKWVATIADTNRYEWPSLKYNDQIITIPRNEADESQDEHYSLDFGYDKYKCFVIELNNIGLYNVNILNENGFMGIASLQGYEIYNNENNLISNQWLQDDPAHLLCSISWCISKYYKNIGYTRVNMANKHYYILGSWNDDFTTIFDLYDDHLIKTDTKIKIFDYHV